MITLEDCLAFCNLTEEEILAIAEHEQMPEMAAIALGEYLLHEGKGADKIFQIVVDDIRAAQARNDREAVQALLHVLHHFIKRYPEAAPKQHPWHEAC